MVVDNEEEPMEGVPLEQYRAWLGEKDLEVEKLGFSLYLVKGRRFVLRKVRILSVPVLTWPNWVPHLNNSTLALHLSFPDEDSNLSPSPLRDLSGSLGGQEEEEEQRWLDALEKGELDDNGDLKKEINERLLTARQVSWFILYSVTKYTWRTFCVPRTLLGSKNISSGRTDKISVLMELALVHVSVLV